MLDKTPADSGSRERALGWLFEELQLDEVMVFVAKLVTLIFWWFVGFALLLWVSSLQHHITDRIPLRPLQIDFLFPCQLLARSYMRAGGEVIPLASWLASLQLPHLVHSPCLNASDELSFSQHSQLHLDVDPTQIIANKGVWLSSSTN